MAPLVYILGGIAAGLLGYKVFADQPTAKPQPQPQPQPAPFPTPGFPTSPVNPGTFPNFPGVPAVPTVQPFQPGQRVKVPFTAISAMIPPSMAGTFQAVGVQGVILEVISSTPVTVTGNLVSTFDSQNNPILMPPGIAPVPVTVPITAVTPV